jgi:hypothetical protein
MPKIFIRTRRKRRGRLSVPSIASLIQQHTGATLPTARRLTDQLADGLEVILELDDEYAAYDMASILESFGLAAEVDAEPH